MKKKPLLFTILAFAHFAEPLIKVLYFKLMTSFSFSTVIGNIAQIQTVREVFDFWFLFPIGGIALLSVKKWGYPIFVGVQAYSIYAHLTYEAYTWPYVSEIPFISSLALLFMNAMIIIYFAMPDVRRIFFDKSMRWWETRERFNKRIPVEFIVADQKHPYYCDILNISRSGIFINSDMSLKVGADIEINIAYKGLDLSVYGTVKSQHMFQSEQGVGVNFKFENIWKNLYMKKMIRQISKDIIKEEKLKAHQLESAKKAA